MDTLGTVAFWNFNKEMPDRPFSEFMDSLPDWMVGVHRTTLLRSLKSRFTQKTRYRVEKTAGGQLAILHLEKPGQDEVRGVQIITMDNDKYSVSNLTRHPEYYALHPGDQLWVLDQINAAAVDTELLTNGHVSDNTARHIVLSVCRGATVRAEGGVYFITDENMESFEEYVTAVTQFLGPDVLEVHQLPVTKTDKGLKAMSRNVERDLLSRLSDTLSKLNSVSKGVRAKTTRMSEVTDLFSLASLYEDALEVTFDDLREQLKLARHVIKTSIEQENG